MKWSRDLGRQRSSIELDTAAVKPGEMEALETAVNEKIRAHIPVTVNLLSIDDPAVEKVCVHLQKSTIRLFRKQISTTFTNYRTNELSLISNSMCAIIMKRLATQHKLNEKLNKAKTTINIQQTNIQ